jgi:hypothetical protein
MHSNECCKSLYNKSPHLERNYEKYSGVRNCGWGSPPNYTLIFIGGFYESKPVCEVSFSVNVLQGT